MLQLACQKGFCWQNRIGRSVTEASFKGRGLAMAVLLLTVSVDVNPTSGARLACTWAVWRSVPRPGLTLFGGLAYQANTMGLPRVQWTRSRVIQL